MVSRATRSVLRSAIRLPATPGARVRVSRQAMRGMEDFMVQWARLERIVRDFARENDMPQEPSIRVLYRSDLLLRELLVELSAYRGMRNAIVHGGDTVDSVSVIEGAERLKVLTNEIRCAIARRRRSKE